MPAIPINSTASSSTHLTSTSSSSADTTHPYHTIPRPPSTILAPSRSCQRSTFVSPFLYLDRDSSMSLSSLQPIPMLSYARSDSMQVLESADEAEVYDDDDDDHIFEEYRGNYNQPDGNYEDSDKDKEQQHGGKNSRSPSGESFPDSSVLRTASSSHNNSDDENDESDSSMDLPSPPALTWCDQIAKCDRISPTFVSNFFTKRGASRGISPYHGLSFMMDTIHLLEAETNDESKSPLPEQPPLTLARRLCVPYQYTPPDDGPEHASFTFPRIAYVS